MAAHTVTPITIIGAGLAGCEAAWQLAKREIPVKLIEMKPLDKSAAHIHDGIAELVCSNSFRGASLSSAVGLLKEELGRLESLLMKIARLTAVPAGRALAVDRKLFSKAVEEAVRAHPLISIERRRADSFPDGRVIAATGPLTSGGLADALSVRGVVLHYFDAIAPLIDGDSIDMTAVFRASRYDEAGEGGAYLNCPMDEAQYRGFVEALVAAEKTALGDFEGELFFEGCLPVEELAARGPLTLAYGPMKPVGLVNPATGKRPFAVVQLRSEDLAGTAYNLVGFQTRLARAEQKRVIRMIPGLENAVFMRFGQVHRNSFVDAPKVLDGRLRLKSDPRISVAGQLAGVEGYVESIACGLLAALFAAAELSGDELPPPPRTTAIGGLLEYLRIGQANFQPSNVVWAMMDTPPRGRHEPKRSHREAAAKKALIDLEAWMSLAPNVVGAAPAP